MVLREEPRDLRIHPKGLRISAPERDDRNRGRSMLEFDFALPRGAYATMLVKRLFAPSWYAQKGERGERSGWSSPRDRRDGGHGHGHDLSTRSIVRYDTDNDDDSFQDGP